MSTTPKLAITALTNTPVIVTAKGKTDITHDFHQAVMTWICHGELPEIGKKKTQQLKSGDEVHFEITLKRFK